jgi:hypothetical protein
MAYSLRGKFEFLTNKVVQSVECIIERVIKIEFKGVKYKLMNCSLCENRTLTT